MNSLKVNFFSYGIGGATLKLINSFLCFRQQQSVVKGVKSDWAPASSGITEAVIRGHLLFELYSKDISKYIETQKRPFANDIF